MIKERCIMPYVRITSDTFVGGAIAMKGKELEVSEYSASQLVAAKKAVRIDKLQGEEVKPDLSGTLTAESVKKPAVEAPLEKPAEQEVIYKQPVRNASGRFEKRQKKGGNKR
jgi:hypothetical protein